MNGVQTIQKKFTKQEAKIVQKEIRQSPDITGYSLRELLRLKTVFKAFISNEFAGACANFDFGKDWTELSAFIVIGHHRGQGIGGKLFRTAFIDAIKRKRNIYIVSRNPAMINIIKKYDFKIITSFWQLPAAVIIDTFIFAISWYRTKEFLRKLPMKKSGKFIFGTKLAHS
ncbi:MAG: GNAT family N-acetyltransferase [Candidatus Berkelbacteria bacterium]|nr:GNAT family N-acetyltransferase [Candidatus Berkelbacteria bacterium]